MESESRYFGQVSGLLYFCSNSVSIIVILNLLFITFLSPFYYILFFLPFLCGLLLPFPCSVMGQGSSLLQFYRRVSENILPFSAVREVTY